MGGVGGGGGTSSAFQHLLHVAAPYLSKCEERPHFLQMEKIFHCLFVDALLFMHLIHLKKGSWRGRGGGGAFFTITSSTLHDTSLLDPIYKLVKKFQNKKPDPNSSDHLKMKPSTWLHTCTRISSIGSSGSCRGICRLLENLCLR